MTVTGHIRGHKIMLDDSTGEWFYCDIGIPVSDWEDRPCIRCGCSPTPEGHDACLGYLPGVEYVCCGHGIFDPYIIMKN